MFRLPASPTMQATWPHDAMIPGKNPGIFFMPRVKMDESRPLRASRFPPGFFPADFGERRVLAIFS